LLKFQFIEFGCNHLEIKYSAIAEYLSLLEWQNIKGL